MDSPENHQFVPKATAELQFAERTRFAGRTISKSHRDNSVSWLNDLSAYCGADPVAKIKKGHVQKWLEEHATWRSPATIRKRKGKRKGVRNLFAK